MRLVIKPTATVTKPQKNAFSSEVLPRNMPKTNRTSNTKQKDNTILVSTEIIEALAKKKGINGKIEAKAGDIPSIKDTMRVFSLLILASIESSRLVNMDFSI